MTNKTLKALKGPINKWHDIVYNDGEDLGSRNCPLCKLFFNVDCNGCPVSTKTGKDACHSTPYSIWVDHQKVKHSYIFKIICPECKKLAKKELAFLKSLLPKEQKNGRSNRLE